MDMGQPVFLDRVRHVPCEHDGDLHPAPRPRLGVGNVHLRRVVDNQSLGGGHRLPRNDPWGSSEKGRMVETRAGKTVKKEVERCFGT